MSIRDIIRIVCAMVVMGTVHGANPPSEAPGIAQVFFAQTHVWEPDNAFFNLVGEREALLKVQAYSPTRRLAPAISATLELRGKNLDLPLTGPSVMPPPPIADGKPVRHALDDSFTATIPKEWMHPGLTVTVEMREKSTGKKKGKLLDSRTFDRLTIGAPHQLIICMFDVHFFSPMKRDYPAGWIGELANKLPVSTLEVRRTSGVTFERVVMVPRAGKPATLCASRKEYEQKTGVPFDGEQDLAGSWIGALKHAAGQNGTPQRLFYLNIFGVPGGGEAGGFTGVGQGGQHGLLLHELGHALGLPHWGNVKDYPYRGSLLGVLTKSGDGQAVHVGPTWAYDHTTRTLIPPVTGSGRWKVDPMQGGGTGDQEAPFLYNHFSDHSIQRITGTLNRMISFDEKAGHYVRWDTGTKSYVPVPGKTPPVAMNVDVIAILVSASGVTPEANIVYPPFEPHRSDLLEVYDATAPADRARATAAGYSDATCNICLRVTQGGKVRSYLMKMKIDPGEDPLDAKSLKTGAMNLPASNGVVTQVDLLHAPEVMTRGLSPAAKVLHSWKRAGG